MANKERDLAVKERDLEKVRADFYEQAYKTVTKKRGFRCVLKMLYTFGLGTCK
jgi:hypothetical protein